MSIKPDPLSPPDCDLRGYDYMPLFGQRLFGSALYAEATPDEFRAAIRLWWSAWQQCPAGSLPSSDSGLAMLADYGRDLEGWLKVKERALHGFVKCSDGRLYHPLLCDAAISAYESRLKRDSKRTSDRERLKAWREQRKKRDGGDDGDTGGSAPLPPSETPDETRFNTPDETRPETRVVAGIEKRIKEERIEVSDVKSLTTRVRARKDDEPEFMAFYAAYPKHQARDDGLKAWRSVLAKGAQPAEIMAGLARAHFSPDPQYIPLPGTWLRAGRWKDEPVAVVRNLETAAERRIREQREALHRIVYGDQETTIDHEPAPLLQLRVRA